MTLKSPNTDKCGDCIHPKSMHDPISGRCFDHHPMTGPCNCIGWRPVGTTKNYYLKNAPGYYSSPYGWIS